MTPKEKTIKVLATMPEDSSYEDLQHEVQIVAALEEAENDVKAGRTVPHEEVKRRFEKWISR